MGEIVADCCGWNGDARRPLFDEVLDVEETMIARGLEIFNKLRGGDVRRNECFGTCGPNGSDPGQIGACAPLFGKIKPLAWADGGFDLFAGFKGKEGGVADEDGSVRLL